MIFTPPPDSVGAQQKSANLTRTQQEIAAANATAGSNASKASSEAALAALKLKEEQEAYAAAHPQGNGSTVLGPASLNSLSAPDQELVKALAEGRLAFPSGFALKAPWWQQKLEQVAAYDPTFDATNYNNRAKARAALVSGKLGTSANALNTAIGHIGLLSSQIGGTASHSFTPANTVINALEQVTGDPGITNYKDTASKLASELTSVYRNGGGAEQDVVRQLQNINPDASLAQKQGIVKNALELLASKQAANLYQYNIGSGGKPPVDLLDPQARDVLNQFPDIRDKYFAPSPAPLSSQAAALLQSNGGTPPPPAPPGTPPSQPPVIGGPKSPPGGLGGHPDYSAMVGGPGQSLATGAYRTVYDPVVASGLNALIHKGASLDEANVYITSHGHLPITSPADIAQYNAAVAYAKQPGHKNVNLVNATKTVPTTLGERLAASPEAAAVAGGAAGATGGLSDLVGRTFVPGWDANRAALAATHPTADVLGNVGGGLAAAFGGPALLGKIAPNLAKGISAFSDAHPSLAPALGDMGYGALYGANESPNDPVGGGLAGAITAGGTGLLTRGAMGGLSSLISPSAGATAPLYDAGVYPTLGQRFAKSGVLGAGLNKVEQAIQSVPILGAAPATARQAVRDQFQVGAFNNALKELTPFQNVNGVDVATSLPPGVGPGTAAHSFAVDQFNNAYPAARAGMQFVPDGQYAQDFGNWQRQLGNGVLTPAEQQQVGTVIQNAVGSRMQNGALNGAGYQAAGSDLEQAISKWGRDPAKAAMADALGDYATIFDNAARRSSDPQSAALLDAADRGYAQLVRIQQASAMGGAAKDAGTFTPTNYAGAVQNMGGGVRSSAYNQGNALGQDYANAGLTLSDKLADSGTPTRLAVLGGLQGMEGAGLAAAHGLGALTSPGALAPFVPYMPLIKDVATRAIAPNAQRLSLLSPDVAAALDSTAAQINNLSVPVSRAVVPGALAYRLGQ